MNILESYDDQLAKKTAKVRNEFAEYDIPELMIFPSVPDYYRMRAEFQVWHEGDQCYYRMFDPQTRQPFRVTSFPSGSKMINRLMMPLMEAIILNSDLKNKLFQIEFLTTQTNEALITLIYHRQLDDQWRRAAIILQEQLGVHIIGRARKQKLVLSKDFVTEVLNVDDESFYYTQVENSFTQPNANVNEKMLSWTRRQVQEITEETSGDLLELYCGNGNFTCVLSAYFAKVLVTEISKSSVASALQNFKLNKLNNIQIARLSSEELVQAFNKVRVFYRLKEIDLDSYNFSTILVDPPRSGLDDGVVRLAQKFDNIIYISCNAETLKENLSTICQTHKVNKIAIFDQFPYTHHIEMGVHLVMKK